MKINLRNPGRGAGSRMGDRRGVGNEDGFRGVFGGRGKRWRDLGDGVGRRKGRRKEEGKGKEERWRE